METRAKLHSRASGLEGNFILASRHVLAVSSFAKGRQLSEVYLQLRTGRLGPDAEASYLHSFPFRSISA